MYMYPVKTVTENASFKNTLQSGDFCKRPFAVFAWTNENGFNKDVTVLKLG